MTVLYPCEPPHLSEFFVTVHLPPAVRPLFYCRAGRGAPAKAFLLFWVSATLAPLEKRQQIYNRITLRIIHNTCFESSWGSGFRSLPYGKLHAIALRTVQLLFLSRSPQAFPSSLRLNCNDFPLGVWSVFTKYGGRFRPLSSGKGPESFKKAIDKMHIKLYNIVYVFIV